MENGLISITLQNNGIYQSTYRRRRLIRRKKALYKLNRALNVTSYKNPDFIFFYGYIFVYYLEYTKYSARLIVQIQFAPNSSYIKIYLIAIK